MKYSASSTRVEDARPKWKPDRVTMLPAAIGAELSEQLVRAPALHQEDPAAGFGTYGCRTRSTTKR
jgi:hypothetical protein